MYIKLVPNILSLKLSSFLKLSNFNGSLIEVIVARNFLLL